jgi:hypothetical protein
MANFKVAQLPEIKNPTGSEYLYLVKDGINKKVRLSKLASLAITRLITKYTIGLGDVDNTSDLNKPITQLIRDALEGKKLRSEFLLELADKSDYIHTHSVDQVTDLQTELDLKKDVSLLATKSDLDHTHDIDDVSSLQSSLDNLSNLDHTHGTISSTDDHVYVDGPIELIVGDTGNYFITNYDTSTTYDHEDVNGNSTIDGASFYYYPWVAGDQGFIINGKRFHVNVTNRTPNTPTILAPLNGTTGITTNISIVASAFSIADFVDTQKSSTWEIATDAAFTNIVQFTNNNTIVTDTWSVTGLLPNTDYYVRMKYESYSHGYSDWSSVNTFKTTSIPIWLERAMLSASDKAANNLFGTSVSVSRDGTRCISGAMFANGQAGKAYIFVRSGTTWTQEAILTASDRISGEYQFGCSVSISGDGTRCIVGADRYNPSGRAMGGKAYIYLRSGTTWVEEAILVGELQSYRLFGCSVSIDSTGTRCIVGANGGYGTIYSNIAKVFVYIRSGSTWTQEAILIPSDRVTNDFFGFSASISGDGTMLVAGAIDAKPSGLTYAGKAYIFSRSGTTWTQEAILTASDKAVSDEFGWSVSMDLTGTRCVIGTNGANVSGLTSAGKAYIFLRSGTSWTQEAILTASDKVAYDYFGQSVAISGDGTRCVIGADAVDYTPLSEVGAVYIYIRSGSTWTQEVILTASDKGDSDQFGHSVSMSNDGTRCIIGAYVADSGGKSGAGQSYYFSLE